MIRRSAFSVLALLYVSQAEAQSAVPELRFKGGVISADNTGASCGSHMSWILGADMRTRGRWFVAVAGSLIGPASGICAFAPPAYTYKGMPAERSEEGGLNYNYAVALAFALGLRAGSRLELSAGPGLMRTPSIRGVYHPAVYAEAALSFGSRVSAHFNTGVARSPTRQRFRSPPGNAEIGVEHDTEWPTLLGAAISILLN